MPGAAKAYKKEAGDVAGLLLQRIVAWSATLCR